MAGEYITASDIIQKQKERDEYIREATKDMTPFELAIFLIVYAKAMGEHRHDT